MLEKLKKILGSIGLIAVVAFLGALSGQNWKWLRRYIIPLLVTIYAYFMLQNLWVLTIYLMAFPLSIGYGNPDATDEGSAIGRFFYRLFHNSTLWANVFTRGFVGLLISLTMLSVPILKGTWISFLVGSALIIGVWGAVSWRGFGQFPVKIFGKTYNLLWVDVTVYAVTACAFVVIVQGILG